MKEFVTHGGEHVRSVMVWQLIAVALAAIISALIYATFADVLFGGVLVVLSTWHVHKSVYVAEGDRIRLLKLAGLRFALFLGTLAIAVIVLSLHPLFMVAGMLVAYVAMYIKSLLMIFRQMKGDSRE